MKIFTTQISGGMLFSATFAAIAVLPASAQDPPPAVVISQTAEIGMMARWLEARGERAPDLEDDDVWPLSEDELMPGMLTDGQMTRLAAARADAFDRLFLEFMIEHHEGALTMVETLFLVSGAAQEPEIFQYLTHSDADQSMEIGRMNTMLLARR